MKLPTKPFLGSLLTIGFTLIFAKSAYAAPHLTLSPDTASTPTETGLTIDLLIDTDGIPVNSTDVVIDFDPQIFEISQVTPGSLFTEVYPIIDNSTGNLYLGGIISDPLTPFTGNGVFATIFLTGKSPGTSSFAFRCTPGATNDTNITRNDPAQDVVDCASLIDGSYTITSSDTTPPPSPTPTLNPTPTPEGNNSPSPTPTTTPTPTLTPGEQTTPTVTPPQELPESGSLGPTLTLIILGATLLISSGFLLAI